MEFRCAQGSSFDFTNLEQHASDSFIIPSRFKAEIHCEPTWDKTQQTISLDSPPLSANSSTKTPQHLIEELVDTGIPRHFAADWINKVQSEDSLAATLSDQHFPEEMASSRIGNSRKRLREKKASFDQGTCIFNRSYSCEESVDEDNEGGINFRKETKELLPDDKKDIPFWFEHSPSLADQLAARSSASFSGSFERGWSSSTLDTVSEQDENVFKSAPVSRQPTLESIGSECSDKDDVKSKSQFQRQTPSEAIFRVVETVGVSDMEEESLYSSEVNQILSGKECRNQPPKLVIDLIVDGDDKPVACDWLNITNSSISNRSSPMASPVTVIDRFEITGNDALECENRGENDAHAEETNSKCEATAKSIASAASSMRCSESGRRTPVNFPPPTRDGCDMATQSDIKETHNVSLKPTPSTNRQPLM